MHSYIARSIRREITTFRRHIYYNTIIFTPAASLYLYIFLPFDRKPAEPGCTAAAEVNCNRQITRKTYDAARVVVGIVAVFL